jgi:hypothetical protein
MDRAEREKDRKREKREGERERERERGREADVKRRLSSELKSVITWSRVIELGV